MQRPVPASAHHRRELAARLLALLSLTRHGEVLLADAAPLAVSLLRWHYRRTMWHGSRDFVAARFARPWPDAAAYSDADTDTDTPSGHRGTAGVGHRRDLSLLSADPGCDPAWPGRDPTRGCIPTLAFGPVLVANGLRRS